MPVFIIHECSNILIARYGWSKTAQKAFAYFGNLCKSYSSYNKKKILDDEKLFKDYKIQLLDVVANDYLLIEEYGKKLDELI